MKATKENIAKLPSVADVRTALHRYIDEHLDRQEYRDSVYFGAPFADETGQNITLQIGNFVGTPKVSWGRIAPAPQFATATRVESMTDEAFEQLRKAVAEREARLKAPVAVKR